MLELAPICLSSAEAPTTLRRRFAEVIFASGLLATVSFRN